MKMTSAGVSFATTDVFELRGRYGDHWKDLLYEGLPWLWMRRFPQYVGQVHRLYFGVPIGREQLAYRIVGREVQSLTPSDEPIGWGRELRFADNLARIMLEDLVGGMTVAPPTVMSFAASYTRRWISEEPWMMTSDVIYDWIDELAGNDVLIVCKGCFNRAPFRVTHKIQPFHGWCKRCVSLSAIHGKGDL